MHPYIPLAMLAAVDTTFQRFSFAICFRSRIFTMLLTHFFCNFPESFSSGSLVPARDSSSRQEGPFSAPARYLGSSKAIHMISLLLGTATSGESGVCDSGRLEGREEFSFAMFNRRRNREHFLMHWTTLIRGLQRPAGARRRCSGPRAESDQEPTPILEVSMDSMGNLDVNLIGMDITGLFQDSPFRHLGRKTDLQFIQRTLLDMHACIHNDI